MRKRGCGALTRLKEMSLVCMTHFFHPFPVNAKAPSQAVRLFRLHCNYDLYTNIYRCTNSATGLIEDLKALETSKSGPGWQDADRWGAGDRFLPLQAIVAGGGRVPSWCNAYRIVSPDLILQQSELAKCKSFESTGPCQVLSIAPVLPLMYFGIEKECLQTTCPYSTGRPRRATHCQSQLLYFSVLLSFFAFIILFTASVGLQPHRFRICRRASSA